MRLSEAIRLGAMVGPQTFGDYEDHDTGGTCAMGAAKAACGLGADDSESALWPFLEGDEFLACKCPACHEVPGLPGIDVIIFHLNDDHAWTREQIADWVQTIEPPEAPPAIERTPVEDCAVLDRPSVPVAVYARQGL